MILPQIAVLILATAIFLTREFLLWRGWLRHSLSPELRLTLCQIITLAQSIILFLGTLFLIPLVMIPPTSAIIALLLGYLLLWLLYYDQVSCRKLHIQFVDRHSSKPVSHVAAEVYHPGIMRYSMSDGMGFLIVPYPIPHHISLYKSEYLPLEGFTIPMTAITNETVIIPLLPKTN